MATHKLSDFPCFSTLNDEELALPRLAMDVSQMVFAFFMDDNTVSKFRVLGQLLFSRESWRRTSIVRNKEV